MSNLIHSLPVVILGDRQCRQLNEQIFSSFVVL